MQRNCYRYIMHLSSCKTFSKLVALSNICAQALSCELLLEYITWKPGGWVDVGFYVSVIYESEMSDHYCCLFYHYFWTSAIP